MKILLVNSNPVVSRLFALCTRDAHVQLDEVESISKVEEGEKYDLLFVDDASYVDSVEVFIQEHPGLSKKVFISYEQAGVPGFDLTLKKPFLPSQVLEIMQSADVREEEKNIQEEEPMIFPLEKEEHVSASEAEEENDTPSIFPLASEVHGEELIEEGEDEEEHTKEDDLEEIFPESPHILDSREIEKIKGLLDMEVEEELPAAEVLPEEVIEQRKMEAIKEQLIADGLEIVEGEEIVETLNVDKKNKKKKKNLKTGPFSKKEWDAIQKAFNAELFGLKPKKLKKLLRGKKIEIDLKVKDFN